MYEYCDSNLGALYAKGLLVLGYGRQLSEFWATELECRPDFICTIPLYVPSSW